MRARSRDNTMIALSLSWCKPLLTVLSCDRRVSLATGAGKPQVLPRPLCAEGDRQPSHDRLRGLMIDRQFEFGLQEDRHFCRLLALEYSAGVGSALPIDIRVAVP